MKKRFLVLVCIFFCSCVFAQLNYASFGDMPGLGVVYKENNGNFINLVNVGDGYIIRYRDMENHTACAALVEINKIFETAKVIK